MTADEVAAAIAARLAEIGVCRRHVVLARSTAEADVADELLAAGEIRAFVAVLDARGGVMVSRHTHTPWLAAALDAELEQVMVMVHGIEVTAAEATAVMARRGAS